MGLAAFPTAIALLGLFLWMTCQIASAQLVNDQVPRERTVSAEETLKNQIGIARLRLGPLRVLPTLIVTNAGYDNNVYGTPETCPPITGCERPKTADWTATVSAGARFVAPIGSKIYLQGDALPEYTWYRELSNRRTFGGFYRGSVYGFFNRMSLQVSGYSVKSFTFLTSETETRVVQNTKDGSAKLELDLSRALSVFGGAEALRSRYSSVGDLSPVSVDQRGLDRDDYAARGGIRYRISSEWDVSAGVEATRSEFVTRPQDADNQSVAYLLGIHYSRPRLFVNLAGGYRKGRPYNRSTFPEYQTGTGSYFVSYFLTRKLEAQIYGRRGVSYGSLFPEPTYFIETRNGAGMNLQVHPRVLLRGYGEYGTNDFPVPQVLGEVLTKRTDKASAVGGGFSALLVGKLVLTALVNRSSYTSLFPGLTRTVVRFSTSLSFEGELAR